MVLTTTASMSLLRTRSCSINVAITIALTSASLIGSPSYDAGDILKRSLSKVEAHDHASPGADISSELRRCPKAENFVPDHAFSRSSAAERSLVARRLQQRLEHFCGWNFQDRQGCSRCNTTIRGPERWSIATGDRELLLTETRPDQAI